MERQCSIDSEPFIVVVESERQTCISLEDRGKEEKCGNTPARTHAGKCQTKRAKGVFFYLAQRATVRMTRGLFGMLADMSSKGSLIFSNDTLDFCRFVISETKRFESTCMLLARSSLILAMVY